jgi:predicted transcriptional regulator of viral defense system
VSAPSIAPDWDRLFMTAAAQEGFFTTQQATAAGYSAQLLVHHLKGGSVERVRRGIYRIKHYVPAEHEELVIAWLWSDQQGVLSHETALALHELSDALPHRVHLTLPGAWRKRRFRVPHNIVLHHADVPVNERAWVGPVPTTSPARTLNDCASAGTSPEVLRQAAQQALRRGIVTRAELSAVEQALAPFGGLAA